jgi:hypothetical protein
MVMIDSRRSTIQRPEPEPEYLVGDAQLAAAAFLARYKRPDPRGLPARPAGILPVGSRQRDRCPGSVSSPH